MKLYIGNKNYSSWSLRAWLLLRQLNIPFEEIKLNFADPGWQSRVLSIAPVGKVPLLVDGEHVIWDSLAIVEYIADRFPDAGVWPADRAARAHARAICAEMHAGFVDLRNQLPMNIEARLPGRGWNRAVQKDIDRIFDMWTTCRSTYRSEEGMLYGTFSAADAYYAPVVWRFVTYGIDLPPDVAAYAQAIQQLPSMKAWAEDALKEHTYVPEDEPYRTRR